MGTDTNSNQAAGGTPSSLTAQVLRPSSVIVPQPNPNFRHIGVFPNRQGGLDISVVAPNATAVDFCVLEEYFEKTGKTTSRKQTREHRWSLHGPVEGIWHGHLPNYGPGTTYGFRAFGKWDPDGSSYYNPAKLLLDPYGRGLYGNTELSPALHAHTVDADLYPSGYPLEKSTLNSARQAPHSVVIDNHFDLVPGPKTNWEDTSIYELHVKGFTKNFPGIPPELQGTYAGLAHPASINYLKELGITAVELLPIHAKMDEPFLTDRGLTNYWGYSTLSFFTPEPSYATANAQAIGPQAVIDEFRGMVSILHQAGIEIFLDVVYNHTCEGGDTGPTVCWRGLDSQLYYRHTDERPQTSIDDTGCGNTLNFSEERVVQMTLDSLRYWVTEMGIDGFRFDLAVTLGRLSTGYVPYHPFMVALGTDPTFRDTKMIAEPWDIGPGGWQTGNFPLPFSEWNDRYRDSIRAFWLTDFLNQLGGRGARGPYDLATRLSGSADLFHHSPMLPRGPRASINFIAAHDGFTLADLTSYEHKHNMANLENNQDGSTNNLSWNHGIEGVAGGENEMVDNTGLVEDILFARERSRRNLLSTLLVSAGTPMIVAGDEFGRTQYGNNNAYCQDSPISWIDWGLDKSQERLLQTTKYLLALRKIHPVMRPENFLTGTPAGDDLLPDVSWLAPDGKEMPSEAWGQVGGRAFQMRRSGFAVNDSDLLVVFNGTLDTAAVTLPENHGTKWVLVNDTSWMRPKSGRIRTAENALNEGKHVSVGTCVQMEPQSMQFYLSA